MKEEPIYPEVVKPRLWHTDLTDDQKIAIKLVHGNVGKYIEPLYEHFEFGFLYELDPEKEIAIWMRIVLVLEKYLSLYPEDDNEKSKEKLVNTLIIVSIGGDPSQADGKKVFKDKKRLNRLAKCLSS